MAVRLEWSNEQHIARTERWIPLLETLLQLAVQANDVQAGVVSLSFVDDATIAQLNSAYRGIDEPTDVLSFAMDGEDEFASDADSDVPLERQLGDIVISVPRAQEQAAVYGHSLEREIGFLFVHGFLHLLGYDHEDKQAEQEMFRLQEHILEQAGLVR